MLRFNKSLSAVNSEAAWLHLKFNLPLVVPKFSSIVYLIHAIRGKIRIMDETRIEKALEEIFNNSIRGACGFCYYRQERALYMNINLHVPLNIMLKFSHFFFFLLQY